MYLREVISKGIDACQILFKNVFGQHSFYPPFPFDLARGTAILVSMIDTQKRIAI